MRLSKIKMSGFKSFVDSTVIQFPSDLVGIVGPNGCGKSNIIDAVRWVMGESSRHLRGDTMEDVIFNGSSSRKPVGQASIELSFDNSDGTVGGQYAKYNEIAIRREVARDGQSKYFLNNTRCRRRDVIDIFLGTGLGPRAYAIIEQGMISRLIEAKPEELRVYLEEAAGISMYKERRRETENRIRHTRENLDRLNDVRDEIEKQLSRLQRQAKMAERYKVLKQEERFRKAELLALRWRALRLEADEREKAARQQQNKSDKEQADLRAVEAGIEKMRVAHAGANQKFNDVQGRYYKLGSDISRTEQSIQHGKEMRLRQQEELEQTQGAWDESRQHIVQDRARLAELDDDVAAIEKDFERAQAQLKERADRLEQAEQAMTAWQNEWEDVGRRAAKPEQVAHVEGTRVGHLEQHLELLRRRETGLSAETNQLGDGSQVEIGALQASAVDARTQVDEQERQLKENQRLIDERRAHIQSLSEELTEAQGRNQDLRGRLASLQALQEAALGKREKPVTDWLDRNHLAGAPRLAEQLSVEPGWERALETVLGAYLEAVCVDGTDAVIGVLGKLKHGDLTLLDTRTLGAAAAGDFTPRNTLLGKVKSAWSLDMLLGGIFVADDLGKALTLRETLTARESVVTKDGIWLSRNWLRVARDTNERAGVLAREQEIKTLTRNLEASEKAAASLLGELSENRESLSELEQSRGQLIDASNRAHRVHAESEAKLGMRRAYHTELESRKVQLDSEYSDIQQQLTRCKEELAEARRLSEQAREDVDKFDKMRSALARKRDVLARTLSDTRQKADDQRSIAHELAVRLESQRTARQATQDSLSRMDAQSVHLARRRESIAKLLAHGGAPIEEQEQQLGTLLSQRIDVENALTEARAEVHNLEAELREKDKQRLEHEGRVGELREEQATLQLAQQEVTVRAQTVDEQITGTGFARDELFKEEQEQVTIEEGEERVARLERQISRLGAINLAAIDEYEEQKERKEYLDRQFEDVTSALETLENAMHKIDKETRHRFKDTFERVNVRLQEVYPKLFGGGRAHLELTGTDLLTTGVAVMARPPGKRLSTIHLLSGGEKALTAVALVFAIFELNPAPFCMLDEVDAPLDEANVGRFCELVRSMEERVQFIVITHNKTTMEFLEQLIGVTMQEAGVSRLVAVDIEEAAQMAAG